MQRRVGPRARSRPFARNHIGPIQPLLHRQDAQLACSAAPRAERGRERSPASPTASDRPVVAQARVSGAQRGGRLSRQGGAAIAAMASPPPAHKLIPGCGFLVDGFRYAGHPSAKAFFLSHAHSGERAVATLSCNKRGGRCCFPLRSGWLRPPSI